MNFRNMIYFKRYSINIALLLVIGLNPVFSQISAGGEPYGSQISTLKSLAPLPSYKTLSIDRAALLAEDETNPVPYRYSIFEDVQIDLIKSGDKREVKEDAGHIWRYRLESDDALSLQVFFSSFDIPPGAKLFVYNSDFSLIRGAYTSRNNKIYQSLMLADFPGNEIILEYFEPNEAEFEGSVVIGSIGKGYREFEKSSFYEDEDGYINVNCPEGREWQDEKHAVARFTFRVGSSGFTCSGSLINNVANDGTPYFLTANHCLETESAANTVLAYFNYEFHSCGGTLDNGDQISGATLLATAADSDYTLLLLNESDIDYLPYFAGWDVTGDTAENTVGIHHPASNPKKISIDDSAAVDHPFRISWQGGSDSPPNSHWRVTFDRGITSGGSSGSPLFNENGHIIGQLHGGSSNTDYYGKISYSWTTESQTGNTLQSFLDPEGTGVQVLDAYYPATNKPDPQISLDFRQLCDSAGIVLYGLSAFQPLEWEWSFTPDDVTFLNGTSAASPDPEVAFNSQGNYDITLKVTNEAGIVERTFENAVSVGSEINLAILPLASVDNCLSGFDNLMLVANGATNFSWSLQESTIGDFEIVNDSANPVIVRPLGAIGNSVKIDVLLEARHGSCIAEEDYSLSLISQSNDMITNAIEIFLGESEEFSNECATIEDGEPVPPFDSCTGQNSWCDEYGTGEDIVENSVWFFFVSPDSGDYRLSSEGMDNQIAVYDAETVEDLLAGNYTLVGANDDFTTKDFNPRIQRMTFAKNKTYWIQVDGSAGGEEGNFTFTMEKRAPVGLAESPIIDEIRIYPQPIGDNVVLEWEILRKSNEVNITVYSPSGSVVLSDVYSSSGSNSIIIDLSSLNKGLYFMNIETESSIQTVRLVK